MVHFQARGGLSAPRQKPIKGRPSQRRWIVDTFAVLSFFTVVGGLNEWLIVGMTVPEVLTTRAAAIPILLISGAVYGLWRDLLHRIAGFEDGGRIWRGVVDTLSCLSFRVPVYALILVIGGAQGLPLLHGVLSGAVIIALSGRPLGLWMDGLRRMFGCCPG